MTKDEIINGNVIIATYLGQHEYDDYFDVEKHKYPDLSSFYENATDTLYHKSNLLYHYRRDWLNDAIEEIQKVDNDFEVKEDVDIVEAFKTVIKWIQHYT